MLFSLFKTKSWFYKNLDTNFLQLIFPIPERINSLKPIKLEFSELLHFIII